MSRRYRVGIAGVVHGQVSAHLRAWKEVTQVDVLAIADANRQQRQRDVERFELHDSHRYDSVEEMLASEELDIVSLCTETSRHAAAVVAAGRSLPEHLVRCLDEGRPAAPWAGIAMQRNVAEGSDAGLRSIRSGVPLPLPLPLPLMQATP